MFHVRHVIATILILLSSTSYANVGEFTTKIAELSEVFDFSVTSWIRSESRNEAVGGAKHSQHLNGLAVDVVLDRGSDKKAFIDALDQIGYYYLDEGDHIHIGWRENDTIRVDDPVGIYADRGSPEDMGDETPSSTAAKPSVIRKSGAEEEGGSRSEELQGRWIPVDPEDNSVDSYFCCNPAPEASSVIHGYDSHRGVDTVGAWIPLFNRREGRIKLVRYEGVGDNSSRHSPDECNYRSILRRKHRWAQ